MDYTQKILLNSSINKKTTNENVSLNVNFSGNKKLLPEEDVNGSVDAFSVYLDERKNSNKFRIVVNVNPICTNVLFNPFTEIVRNEGSTSAECLNFIEDGMSTDEANSIIKGTFGQTFVWNQREAIRDTQLSNEFCGFDYHCGIDIFNNHTLRQRESASINYDYTNSPLKIGTLESGYTEDDSIKTIYGVSYKNVFVNEAYKNAETAEERAAHSHVYVGNNFNTIDDYKRDKSGTIISEHLPKLLPDNTIDDPGIYTYVVPMHVYQYYNTSTFEESVKENLREVDGWYGFENKMVLSRVTIDGHNEPININKTINTREYGDFIDMYPGRELYSFTPIYNESRKRLERNWDYCITYPSRNVTDNDGEEFPFFTTDSSGKTALKVYMFDEGTVDDNGTKLLTIYSVCQHGLVEGDAINIYKNDDLFYNSVFVKHVVDKYIFQVVKDTANMSEEWVELDGRGDGVLAYYTCESINEDDEICGYRGIETDFVDGECPICGKKDIIVNYYPICASNRCNVDPDAQNVYFRRVVNGVECEYYVRMFSRLPNFKFRYEEINDYTLYDDDFNRRKIEEEELPLLRRFSNPGDSRSEFESHCAKLGFAETSYGDDATEIVFTDDIDTSYIRDNLGRPLSDIYLTIVKNNRGYKDWYGIGCGINITGETVEYSHCFGKVNSSFLLSEYFREYYNSNKDVRYNNLYDVRDITAEPNKNFSLRIDNSDEIEFNKEFDYYGDICCYSPVDCDEQVIQNAMHRFNTVQREIENISAEASQYFGTRGEDGTMEVDEIFNDENRLLYTMSGPTGNLGDPYDLYAQGDERRREGINPQLGIMALWHTINHWYYNMTNFKEGYYYQPHYRISVKTVSSKLSSDKAIQYEIFEFIDTNATNKENREVFELTTTEPNYFLINEKMVMYKRSTNEYFYITVTKLIDFNKFKCVIADENGSHLNIVDFLHGNEVVKGTWGDDGSFTESEEGSDYAVKIEDLYIKPNDYILENINDYVLIKKHEETPAYAKLIKDGSCRYCWREVVSNGIEDDKNVFPFTNGAFYINRRINFYLRRQDPYKEYLGRVGTNVYDYVPDGEDIRDYPNLNFYDDDNYNINEIEEC